jgi:hypothetical protein
MFAAVGFAGEKPRCNEHNQGRFWPEAANVSANALRTAARDGSLEMCSAVWWKYKWEPVTVSVRTLLKKRKVPVANTVNRGAN